MSKLLDVSDLSMRFGGLLAVNGVKLQLKEKEIVSIIGPNGAGKTTVFNCLTGFYKPTNGLIRFKGEEIQVYRVMKLPGKGLFVHSSTCVFLKR